MSRSRILVTGAAGKVGQAIAPLLRDRFSLRLLDRRRIRPADDDEVIRADIRRSRALARACRGVAAVVHLAAIPREEDFASRLLPMNILGTYRVFEAARLAGVPRVVFASTVRTVFGYPLSQPVTASMPVRPISLYACTKVFGEALARYYADVHGMSVICLRIGSFAAEPRRRSSVGERVRWCSPADLAQLVVRGIESDVRFGIFHAVSGIPGNNLDIEEAREVLGFDPNDRIEDHPPLSPEPGVSR